ncbi:hypothetical protein VZO05_14505 [Aggregatilineales bacterium SYSU G02658]
MSYLAHAEQEHRRAMARHILAQDPTNQAVQSALSALLTPQHLAVAAREGVLIIAHENDASPARALAQAMREKHFDAHCDLIGARPSLHTNLSHVGAVVLICNCPSQHESALRQCYDRAMSLGKVVVPVVHCEDTLPNLLFDLPPLCIKSDLSEVAERLVAMFSPASL